MYPTIPSSGAVQIISRSSRHGHNLRVGDHVDAYNPHIPGSRVGKRVVGMPGDYVLYDANMAPSPGGAAVPPGVAEDEDREEPRMIQVPEGHVWLAGDNLSYSRDSRFYGPVPMALVVGKPVWNGDGFASMKYLGGEQLRRVDETGDVD